MIENSVMKELKNTTLEKVELGFLSQLLVLIVVGGRFNIVKDSMISHLL